MLLATVEIVSVDYEASMARLLPKAIRRLQQGERPSLWAQLLEKLGEETAVQVARRLVGLLSRQEQTMLLCELSGVYQEVLVKKINETLGTLDWGQALQLRNLRARQQEEGLVLYLEGIEIDYSRLMTCQTVQQKLNSVMGGGNWNGLARWIGLAAGHSSDHIEQAAAALLRQDMIQTKLLPVLENNMRQAGFLVRLARMELSSLQQAVEPRKPESLSEQAQEALITALACWLRQSVEEEQ